VSSPALDRPLRTREQAALDRARWALGEIARECRELETVTFVRGQIRDIAELMGEAK
jgi:hypothetical protein